MFSMNSGQCILGHSFSHDSFEDIVVDLFSEDFLKENKGCFETLSRKVAHSLGLDSHYNGNQTKQIIIGFELKNGETAYNHIKMINEKSKILSEIEYFKKRAFLHFFSASNVY